MARAVGAVEPIVAGLAEAAERAEPEGGVVAPMRLDAISDRRRHHVAALKAKPTQWLDMELMAALPEGCAKPGVVTGAVLKGLPH